MSSPVNLRFDQFIKVDRSKSDPVYMQVVRQFVQAIQNNLLEEGDQLPGSRQLAAQLGMHRKTIVAALGELRQQGWLESLPNVGTFILNPESRRTEPSQRLGAQPPGKAPYAFKKESILDMPVSESPGRYYLTAGTPDHRIIAPEELIRAYGSVLKRHKKNPGSTPGEEAQLFFREQLSYYLNITRKFRLSRNFLLPVAGREQVFSIIARLLIGRGDVVLVEALSYFLPNMIFSQAGADLRTVPLDSGGMDVEYIASHYKPGEIRLVYLNSRAQYPTTVPMSASGKRRLLELAHRYGFVIIEDDVDFEFSLSGSKQETLFRQDAGNRVVYTGSFGGFLPPGFQMHFLLGPQDLLEEARKYLNIFGKPEGMLEKVLGETIIEGDVLRYQRKSNKILAERRAYWNTLLKQRFGPDIRFELPESGLAFWIRFIKPVSLVKLKDVAAGMGLVIPGICLYQSRNVRAMRIGYAHLSSQEMETVLDLLHRAYLQVQPKAE